MRRLFCAVVCLMAAMVLGNEQHFPEREWSKLQIPGFVIVYPRGMDDEAQYVAERLATYWPQLQQSMPLSYRNRIDAPRRIPILLSTPTLVSNGYVNYDPFRSVYFNQPSPLGGLEWFDMLSVHEGRHLVQLLQPLDTVTGRAAFLLAGEMGPAALVLLFYPSWLLEGDAVLEETRLTSGGRGRVASFELWQRTHALTQRRYSYERAMLGTGFESFPFVSPYDLGYFLTAYLRRHHGDNILDSALASVATPGSGFSLDGSIAQLTGDDLSLTYDKAMDELSLIWRQQHAALNITEVSSLWKPHGRHWQSLYPVGVEGDTVMAVETDVREGSHLVSVREGRHQRLAPLSRRVAGHFYGTAKQRSVSYGAGRFCWTEDQSHPRFAMETGRDIFCYDTHDGQQLRLTRGGQFTSVALHRDGDSLVAHRFTESRTSDLVLMDADGRVQTEVTLPTRSLAYDIAAGASGQWVFVLLDGRGVRFMEWRPGAGGLRELSDPVRGETLRSPQLDGQWLLYTSDLSGIDSLWALNLDSKERYQVSQRAFGNYFAILDRANARVVMTDYGPQGHSLVSLPWTGSAKPAKHWLSADNPASRPTDYSAPLQLKPEPTAPPEGEVSPYRRSTNALDLNYWFVEADDQQVRANIHANNLLNTLTLDAFVGTPWRELTPLGGATLQWRRWWPVVTVGANRILTDGDDFVDTEARASLSLPLTFNRSVVSTRIEPFAGVKRTQRESLQSDASVTSTQLSGGLLFNYAWQPAIRDLQSPLAISNQFTVDWELESETAQAHDFLELKLPGLRPNHHVTLSNQLQYRPSDFLGSPRLDRPRALLDIATGETTWAGHSRYRFSLGPAAWSLGRLWYLRSVELSLDAQAVATDMDSAIAFGPTLTFPSNILRNSLLRLDPSFSFYYRPDRDEVVTLFNITLGGG